MTEEDIRIKLQAVGVPELQQALKMAGVSFRQFSNHMKSNFLWLDKSGNITNRLSKNMKGLGNVIKTVQQKMLSLNQIQAKSVSHFQKQMGALPVQSLDTFGRALDRSGISAKVFRKNMPDWKDVGGEMWNKVTGQVQSYGTAVNQAAVQSRRFKMEWLSVMFAGMAISRVFGGLVKTQMQLFGVTDMLSAMWTLILLPVMETIVPILMDVITWLMNLPDSVKQAIGTFVILAAVLGGALMVIGQVALGIAGLSALFAGTALSGGALAAIFGVIGTKLWMVFNKFITLKKSGMSTIDALIASFTGFKLNITGIFSSLFSLVKAIMKGDMGEAWEIIKDITSSATRWLKDRVISGFSWIWNQLKGLLPTWMTDVIGAGWDALLRYIDNFRQAKSLGDALMKTVKSLKNDFIAAVKYLWDAVKPYLPTWMVEGFEKGWDSVLLWFQETSQAKSLGAAIEATVKLIKTWGAIGLFIAEKMVEEIVKNLPRLFKSAMKSLGGLLGSFFGGKEKITMEIIPPKELTGYQTGGLVTETGPALLHRGERVIPKGRTSSGGEVVFSPTVYISSTINNDMDIRSLATKLNSYWIKDFERISQTRGI